MRASVSEAPPTVAFVTLKGGLIVPLEALQLAWALEDRGATLVVEGPDLIVDIDGSCLTDRDRAAIRRWKLQLMAIATSEAPPPETVQ